jgi:hypothetical protein
MEPLHCVIAASCEFCDEALGKPPDLLGLQLPLKSRLFRHRLSESLYILPDASPITSKHALAIPREHIPRFSLYGDSDLCFLMQDMRSTLRGSDHLVFFEHGGLSCLGQGKCSQHAHLHLVSVSNFNMTSFLLKASEMGATLSERHKSISDVYHSLNVNRIPEYLIFGAATCSDIDVRTVHLESIPSQLLRYVLAELLGVKAHFEQPESRLHAFSDTMKWLDGIGLKASA